VPEALDRDHTGRVSTQQAFGRFFVDLGHKAPEVARHVVTVSPDVASSTNLGGWINHVGIWHLGDRIDWFADDSDTLVRWRESEQGQHLELGIAEGNLVGVLGELGATWSRDGQPLLPVGTIYDPFVNRALEPWSFGIYAGGQSILVGTPSGVTPRPGGRGAPVGHHAVGRPRAAGLRRRGSPHSPRTWSGRCSPRSAGSGRPGGTRRTSASAPGRSTRRSPRCPPVPEARAERRRQALAGGYRLRTAGRAPDVTLAGRGRDAARDARRRSGARGRGIAADVVCLTSADLVFRALQARRGLADGDESVLDDILPAERAAPLVTVLDGHPHTLGLPRRRAARAGHLPGRAGLRPVGDVGDLYAHFGLDTDTIVGAAWTCSGADRRTARITDVTEITMPALSESMEEGTILTWLRADGDEIAVGDELVEIETDKATMSYAAEAAGVLQIVAPVGTSVAVGDPIAVLDGAPGAPVHADGTEGLRQAAGVADEQPAPAQSRPPRSATQPA
jgi:pyruvate dehydrogenase E1 component